MTEQLSKTSTDLDRESLLARVSVRPPTPDKCAVCLNNKQTDVIARIDSCSHTFCFPCILEWSKVRAICPLCKQPFSLITRERYSGDIVEEVRVETPRRAPSRTFTNINDVLNWVGERHRSGPDRSSDIFRQMVYIEWLNTIQAIVRRPTNTSRHVPLSTSVRSNNPSSSWSNIIPLDSVRRLLHRYLRQTTSDLRESTVYSQSTRQTVAFRKYIYLNRLFVQSPLIGQDHDTLTVRECSPTWYASNPACLHRLVPFLARELLALLWNDERTIEHIIQEILTNIQLHEIRSNVLSRKLNDYLGRYTKHFLHEFYTFARCPYDLAGFDRHAQYPAVNFSSRRIPPISISLDDDDEDDEGRDEQSPIVLDETPDVSILTVEHSSSSSSSSQTTNDSEHRSSSPECEIVECVEPNRERTSPTLIVLSEDENDDDAEEPPTQISSSTKRKHQSNHYHARTKRQQATTGDLMILLAKSF